MSQQWALGAFQHDKAYARVSRVGRWTWRVRVRVPVSGDGLGDATFDTRDVFGRQRAERAALRMVKRYVRNHVQQEDEAFEVHSDTGGEGL
jgi:hypothetical protein